MSLCPVICSNDSSHIYGTQIPQIVVEFKLTIEGVETDPGMIYGPCPFCHAAGKRSMGTLLSGLGFVKILTKHLVEESDIEQLKHYKEILERATVTKDFDEAANQLSTIESGWLNLWGILDSDDPMVKLHLIWILIASIGVAIQLKEMGTEGDQSQPDITINQTINISNDDFLEKTIESFLKAQSQRQPVPSPQNNNPFQRSRIQQAIKRELYPQVPPLGFDKKIRLK